MSSRLDLQSKLEELLGNRNVYYNPPSNLVMQYPCIRYSLKGLDVKHADNIKYSNTKRYEGIVICKESDPEVVDLLLELQYCALGSPYKAENLNHYPFTIYF